MAKTSSYYRGLPYRRRVRLEHEEAGEEYFVAFIEELDGVEASGDTPTEALFNLQPAFDDYIDAMLKWGDAIPEPSVWPESLGWSADEVLTVRGPVTVEGFLPGGEDVPPLLKEAAEAVWREAGREDLVTAGA